MGTEVFFQKIKTYGNLSKEAEDDWTRLLKARSYKKGSDFLLLSEIPQKVAFVVKGLFAQYYVSDVGETVIKNFFPEGRIAGSIPATLTRTESVFSITALEDTSVLEYDFHDFKKLVSKHRDVAEFYIRYIERHWIVEKEPYEISFRNDAARSRYEQFSSEYPDLVKKLKKHHIAAFLGITPTHLSRILTGK